MPVPAVALSFNSIGGLTGGVDHVRGRPRSRRSSTLDCGVAGTRGDGLADDRSGAGRARDAGSDALEERARTDGCECQHRDAEEKLHCVVLSWGPRLFPARCGRETVDASERGVVSSSEPRVRPVATPSKE